ncbi:MAG TPA: exodeoxyribonuclease VII large subunit [Bacteroidales bacterium]|nr:exodeoxyribonuclease VII large subunit [Bacteroidales bacterium]
MLPKLTLLELNKQIQDSLRQHFTDFLWVVAEISEIKINRNGHCYLELIEKDAINENIIARSRATIWAFTFRMLKPYFESTTGQELASGIKVLVKASVEYHELYGLSLNITDIDPNYTIGDLAQKKSETLARLISDGVFEMNKEIPFPIVPKRIAIISSETAAGYQDFMQQLNNNSNKYTYTTKLFPSIMQGLQAEDSIIHSLEKIYMYETLFDVVVIIRGGGSQADLHCFNNYFLASNVAQFPIPVLTGIGHDKDESVVDLVAYKKLKTPTAVAEYIIEKTLEFEQQLEFFKDGLINIVDDYFNNQKDYIQNLMTNITPVIKGNITEKKHNLQLTEIVLKNKLERYFGLQHKKITNLSINNVNRANKHFEKASRHMYSLESNFRNGIKIFLYKNKQSLNRLENKFDLVNPVNILKKGYSITYKNGKKITDSSKIDENDIIFTKLFSGILRSTVIKNDLSED